MKKILILFVLVLFAAACNDKLPEEMQGRDINELLLEQVYEGNFNYVKFILKKGADVNHNPGGTTPLITAATTPNTHPDIYNYLVKKGGDQFAEVTLTNGLKTSAIEMLMMFDRKPIIHNLKDKKLNGLYVWAAIRGDNLDAVKYFIDKGVPVDIYPMAQYPFTPLYWASGSNNTEIAKYLIDRGANVNAVETGFTPLAAAVTNKNMELIKYLVEHGADVNLGEGKPLPFAILNNDLEAVKYLTEHGANLNPKVEEDEPTPLELAQRYNYKQIAAYLKSKGAK
ncbi:ankyrin repeat protein [Elusimicrobium simillimum]|uniref:ankyrin repeat domain-containing protein n=1 Tax=Elusimicrobium simillimum TaxID=3143438 RepID=UPI003C6FFF59